MEDADHGAPVMTDQIPQEIEDGNLVGDIEKGGWFVQQQQWRFLGEHHGNPDTLALSAGQGLDRPLCEIGDSGQRDRFGDGAFVLIAPVAKEALVWKAPARHQIKDGDAFRHRRLLWQQPELAGHLARLQLGDVVAVEHNGSGSCRQQARKSGQESRLS